MKRPADEPAVRPALTPLIDIAFLVLIFFMALPLKHLAFKLNAHLPQQGLTSVRDAEPVDRIRIRLRLLADRVIYELGDRAAPRPQGLQRYLRALGPDNIYEIHASAAVPWKAVIAMANELTALDYSGMAFYGTRIPGADIRKMMPLPKPG